MAEQRIRNAQAGGSIPLSGTIYRNYLLSGQEYGVSCQLIIPYLTHTSSRKEINNTSGETGMGDHSGAVDSSNSRRPSYDVDNTVCKVCNGRKYTLVATRRSNQTSVVYDRQICQACAAEESIAVAEVNQQTPSSGKKTLRGTGYLRNKKRRRKEASREPLIDS